MSRKSRSEIHNPSDLTALLPDAERALSNIASAAGGKFSELRDRMRSTLETGRAETSRRAKQAGELIHEHPCHAIGIAAGTGALTVS